MSAVRKCCIIFLHAKTQLMITGKRSRLYCYDINHVTVRPACFILLGTSSVMKVFSHSVMDVLWILWPSGPGQEQEMKNEELRGVLFRIWKLEKKAKHPFSQLKPQLHKLRHFFYAFFATSCLTFFFYCFLPSFLPLFSGWAIYYSVNLILKENNVFYISYV